MKAHLVASLVILDNLDEWKKNDQTDIDETHVPDFYNFISCQFGTLLSIDAT